MNLTYSDAILTTASLVVTAVLLAAKGELAWALCAAVCAFAAVYAATRGWQRATGEARERP